MLPEFYPGQLVLLASLLVCMCICIMTPATVRSRGHDPSTFPSFSHSFTIFSYVFLLFHPLASHSPWPPIISNRGEGPVYVRDQMKYQLRSTLTNHFGGWTVSRAQFTPFTYVSHLGVENCFKIGPHFGTQPHFGAWPIFGVEPHFGGWPHFGRGPILV